MKAEEKDFILANLHLHAVLPRLAELVKLDDEAREIAEKMNLSLRFRVLHGPTTTLNVKRGAVTMSAASGLSLGHMGLLFLSSAQLNKMFMDETAIPIPYKNLTNALHLKGFAKLTELMTGYLKPDPARLEDPEFKLKHVEMALMVALSGAGIVAKHDPKMDKVASHLPDGTLQVSVWPDGPFAFVTVRDGEVTVQNGKTAEPSADLEFRNVDIAHALLSNNLDSFAALGCGDVKASGMLALVDEYSALLDRVGYYLS